MKYTAVKKSAAATSPEWRISEQSLAVGDTVQCWYLQFVDSADLGSVYNLYLLNIIR